MAAKLTFIKRVLTFLDEQENIWKNWGDKLRHGITTENETLVNKAMQDGYKSFKDHLSRTTTATLTYSKGLKLQLEELDNQFANFKLETQVRKSEARLQSLKENIEEAQRHVATYHSSVADIQ